MLTPRFSLRQDDEFLHVTIHAPYTQVSETEVFMDATDLRFFSKPYFLRLHLPSEVVEDDRASVRYEADTGSFLVQAPKRVKGQFFANLDMLTSLLTPPRSVQPPRVLIESLDAPGEEDEAEIDWYVDQQVPLEDPEDEVAVGLKGPDFHYGFAFARHDVFERLLPESQELLDIRDPDRTRQSRRRALRVAQEAADFCEDHYLGDLFDSDQVEHYLQAASPWAEREERPMTEAEADRLIALPKQEYLIESPDLPHVYYGLIDLLFAYCYDLRTTDLEHSSESGWTVSKLSASLVCSEKHASLTACVVSSIRRSLIYPLYRHFGLALRVLADVIDVLHVGKTAIVQCLVELMPLMRESDGRYIFNQLYIEPYTVWIQSVHPAHIQSLVQALEKTVGGLTKADLELDLDEIERVAQLVMDDESLPNDELEHVADQITSLTLKEADSSSGSSDDSDSSSSSYESSSEESSEEEEEKPVKSVKS